MEISIYNETEEKIDDILEIMHDVLVHGVDKLKVGDVLLSGSPYYGHIWLYTGNEVVKMKYPTSTANGYEAGYNSTKGQSYYPHLFNISSDQKNRIEFTIFRNEHYNDKIYNKVL